MEKDNRQSPQLPVRNVIGFLVGFVVLLLLNKFWLKHDNYILQTILEASIVLFLLLSLKLIFKKKKTNN